MIVLALCLQSTLRIVKVYLSLHSLRSCTALPLPHLQQSPNYYHSPTPLPEQTTFFAVLATG